MYHLLLNSYFSLLTFPAQKEEVKSCMIYFHSCPIERIGHSESVSGSISESVSTRFFRPAIAIHADPFDSDTDTAPDTDGNSNTPYSSKALCFREMNFLGVYGTSVIYFLTLNSYFLLFLQFRMASHIASMLATGVSSSTVSWLAPAM